MAKGVKKTGDRTDYLFRISIKALIQNDKGETLVVKEDGRTWWDLPGGGMEHGETLKTALVRELKEELNLTKDFTYQVLEAEDPHLILSADCWQVRLILRVIPTDDSFFEIENTDKMKFIGIEELEADGERASGIVKRHTTTA